MCYDIVTFSTPVGEIAEVKAPPRRGARKPQLLGWHELYISRSAPASIRAHFLTAGLELCADITTG